MTRDALYRAYDGLRPSDAARERMLQAVKEAAAHPETEEEHPQRHTPAFRRTLVLAAALVLIVAFGSVAYATGWFGLRSAVMYHDNGDPDQPYGNTDVMSLQGLAGSPEFEANARWHAFYESYDPDGAILASVGNSDTGLEPRYDAYPCYTREMADTLDAIAAESGLELLSGLVTYDNAADIPGWMQSILPQSCGAFDHCTYDAYSFDSGSFKTEGAFLFCDAQWPYETNYQFVCNRKGYLSVSYLAIGDADDYTQWAYETASGVTVTLALGPDKALIIADLPDAYLVVNVLDVRVGDVQQGEASLPAEILEAMADAFRFDQLA